MSPSIADPILPVAVSIAVKSTIVLGVGALTAALLRTRASAATRHLIWTLTVLALLALPVLTLVAPAWPVITRVVAPPAGAAPAIEAVAVEAISPVPPAVVSPPRVKPPPDAIGASGPTRRVGWGVVLAAVYSIGLAVMMAFLARQSRLARRLVRESSGVPDPEWTGLLDSCARLMHVGRPVRLLWNRQRGMPVALGVRRPAIVLPSIADAWSDDRRRAVLLHELAHVARWDCLTQSLACAACALYWFHPAAWWAARRLQIERELACDDLVIATGTGAREYASHLLEIAYDFGASRAPALAVSMARPRQLERRLLALVDSARNRTVPAARLRIASALAAIALLAPVAAATTNEVTIAQAGRPPVRLEKTLIEASLIDAGWRLLRAVAAAVGVAQDRLPGTWEIRPTGTEGVVHLRIVEINSSSGTNVPLDRLEGLTSSQLAASGPVQFRLRRDAGTFTFEGVARNGVAAGTFSFAPSATFPGELAKRGYAAPTALEQYQLARHDVGLAFVDELAKQNYARPSTPDLVRAAQHGVNATYLTEMGALGYRLGAIEPLITLRDHGVTPGYIRGLADLGYKGLPADDLREARDHGITPEYVRGMRDAGYGGLTMEQLITARDHGVTDDFVRDLASAGHAKVPLDELVRVRDHGVDPEYVNELRKLGHSLTLSELVRTRDHGVDIGFARGMSALGYGSLPIESLIRARDHGVTPDYVRDIQGLGYDKLTIDDLVTLRDHGLTADRIRSLNDRAGSRLPVEMLRSLAAGGAK